MSRVVLHLALLVLLLLAGCAGRPSTPPQEPEFLPGTLLRFALGQHGELRLLAVEGVLRVEDSRQPERYWLYRARDDQLFEIDRRQRVVREYPRRHLPPRPPLAWQVTAEPSQALIHSSVRRQARALHYRFSLQNRPCYDMVVLQGRLQAVLELLRGYRQARAAVDFARFDADDHQRLCGEAFAYYQPQQSLQYGFPIREWAASGYTLFLSDYRPQVMLPAQRFRLPAAYRRVTAD